MQVLNNVATLDKYDAALTLEQDTADTLTYVVANSPVVAQFRPIAHRGEARYSYGDEVLITPASNQVHSVSGVRFRSAVAGSPARVIAILTSPQDPQLAAGTPFTSTLSAAGALGGGSLNVPRIALANWPPANPTNQDAYALAIAADLEWLVEYNSSTGFWDVLGGPAGLVAEAVNGAFNTAVYADPSVVATITIPRVGRYDLEYWADVVPPAGGTGHVSPKIGAALAVDADSTNPAAAANAVGGKRIKTDVSLATNDVVKLQVRTLVAGAGNIRTANLRIVPRRIQ